MMTKLNPSMDLTSMNQSAQAQIELIENNQAIGIMTEKRWSELYQQLIELKIIKNKINLQEVFVNL